MVRTNKTAMTKERRPGHYTREILDVITRTL